MVKKKNNNIWYILGGVAIFVLIITIIVIQVQNAERQKELQRQQEKMQFKINTEKCIRTCSSEWNKQQGSCAEVFNRERSNGWMPSSTDSNILDCDGSLPTLEDGTTCQCKCVCAGLTSNFLI